MCCSPPFIRLAFARSPFWRTKWLEHQKELHSQQQRDGLRPGETELPEPKSMLRGNDTRWQSRYDECTYHLQHFSYFASFYDKVCESARVPIAHLIVSIQASRISDSETIKALHDMLESRKKVVQAELAFAVKVLEPFYQTISALQANAGGILDVLAIFTGYAFSSVSCVLCLLSVGQAARGGATTYERTALRGQKDHQAHECGYSVKVGQGV